jgi:transcriptional regulator with XRE-family HTH domain
MARAALTWTLQDLEERSQVGRNTISRYEAGKDILASSLEKLEEVLKNEGIVFFDGDRTYGTGVGLNKRQRSKR